MSEVQNGVLEVFANLQGSIHRMFSLPQWGERYTFYSRRWKSWCGLHLEVLPGGCVMTPTPNVTCIGCVTAAVPDYLRGCTPPFESMG